jgi:hypothetical protein
VISELTTRFPDAFMVGLEGHVVVARVRKSRFCCDPKQVDLLVEYGNS